MQKKYLLWSIKQAYLGICFVGFVSLKLQYECSINSIGESLNSLYTPSCKGVGVEGVIKKHNRLLNFVGLL